jgi:hypothetical protein
MQHYELGTAIAVLMIMKQIHRGCGFVQDHPNIESWNEDSDPNLPCSKTIAFSISESIQLIIIFTFLFLCPDFCSLDTLGKCRSGLSIRIHVWKPYLAVSLDLEIGF